MGRPTKLTKEVRECIVGHLRNGASRTDAVGAACIEYKTFLNWMDAGSQPEAQNGVLLFYTEVTRAEAEIAAEMANVIREAAPKDWRAAESWLKRRRRDDWGDNLAVDIDTAVARTISQLANVGKEAVPSEAPVGVAVTETSARPTDIRIQYLDDDPPAVPPSVPA